MSEEDTRLTARSGYQPQFSWSYLQPKYWLIWLGIFGLILLAFVPFRLRDKLASYIGKIVARKAKSNVTVPRLIYNIVFLTGQKRNVNRQSKKCL